MDAPRSVARWARNFRSQGSFASALVESGFMQRYLSTEREIRTEGNEGNKDFVPFVAFCKNYSPSRGGNSKVVFPFSSITRYAGNGLPAFEMKPFSRSVLPSV